MPLHLVWADVRKVIQQAEERLKMYGKKYIPAVGTNATRWSKSQSDSILPAIEKGTIRFIGSHHRKPNDCYDARHRQQM